METFKRIWSAVIVKNKFLLALTLFVVWVAIFDRYNLVDRITAIQEIKSLESDKEYYTIKIEEDSVALENLTQDPQYLERFAREKYLMKKDNEDVFVIVKE